jgi:septum site-determining protein MinD
VCNIAVFLGQKLKRRVLAVDANLMAPNLGLHFGELEPKITIHDVLSNKAPIEKAILKRHGIDVIFGSIAFREEVHLVDLRAHLEPLRSKYHVIILDSAPGLGPEVISAMRAADEIIAVTNPLLPTVASTIKTFGTAEQLKVPVMGVVINKVRGEPFELSTKDIKKALGWPVLVSVPEDPKVREATAAGTPVISFAPSSPGARRFRQLGEKIYQFLFA